MSRTASVLDLLERSRESLAVAYAASRASDRHLAAGLAALRAGAALVVARGSTRQVHAGAGDVWGQVTRVAPELGEWAELFALVTAERAGVEQGHIRVSVREADDLLRDAERLVDLVSVRLGVPVPDHAHARLAPARSA